MPPADEAELAANWEQQLEEVEALSAIYGSEDFWGLRVLRSDGFQAEGGPGMHSGGPDDDADGDGGAAAALLSTLALQPPPQGDWEMAANLRVQAELPPGGVLVTLGTQSRSSGAGADPACAAAEQGQAAEGTAARGGEVQDSDAPGSGSSSSSSSEACRLQHLPPLWLRLRLGSGYPSHSPPEVSLSAAWLAPGQAEDLCRQLAQLWEEQGPGTPIIYTWADWLQGSALQRVLAGGAALVLHPGPGRSRGPTLPGQEPPAGEQPDSGGEAQLLRLLRYSAGREAAAFLAGLHTCCICLEEQRGSEFVRLDCRHQACQGCLAAAAALHVREGSIEQLRCPEPRCGAALHPAVLQRLLGPEDFARWEALSLQRTLDAMPDAAYCPRCSSLVLEDEDSCAQCPKCFYVFCTLCCESWHPGTQCVSAATRLAMLRRKMEGGGRAAVEDLRRREQEAMSLAKIEATAKRCPCCGMAIERDSGCNKMTCSNCQALFCYRCGADVTEAGYKHFQAEGGCVLFDEAEILRWEAQFNDQAERVAGNAFRNELLGINEAQAAGMARPLPCPACGQPNYRLANNNHVCCWSCTGHFCALCRTVLRRGQGAAHFGPTKPCRQHTAG